MTAQLSITADNQRRVWVNGQQVEWTGNEWHQATRLQVPLFRHPQRENVVAVLATNLSSQAGLDRGLLADVRWNGALLLTNAQWKQQSALDGGWNENDPAWRTPGFNDSSWPNARQQASNGSQPWGTVLLVHSNASWIWSYFSDVPGKPDIEPVFFRRRFYIDVNGAFVDTPTQCP